MSSRRRRSIFSQGSESYNYRFGSAKQRKRYRVRSRRRFVASISVLVLLIVLLLALFHFGILGRDKDEAPSSQPASGQSADTQEGTVTSSTSEDVSRASSSGTSARTPLGNQLLIAGTAAADPSRGHWELVFVNAWHDLPEDFNVTTAEILGGYHLDERIVEDFNAMIAACQENQIWPVVVSGYRSAGDTAGGSASPEHATGLAVDIMDGSSSMMYNDAQGDTEVQQWLREHSWEYGFVRRYPSDKVHITGVRYEPWHYRYVGKDAAKEMYEKNLCLEEYLDQTDHPDIEPVYAE